MIIHSPIISGSLTFADGATFTFPDGGVYSGSFSGSISGIGDPESFSASLQDEISQLKVDTGSQDARLDLLEIYTSSQDTKNSTLGTYSSSIDTKNSTLGTYTSSLETKNSTLATYTGSVDTKFSTLATLSGSIQTKNDTLGTYTASLETKNSTLASYTASVDTKFGTIGTYTGSSDTTLSNLATKNDTLGTYTASLETKNSTLATTTGSLLSSQTNLNTYTGSLLGAFQVTGSKINFLGDVVIYGTQSVINSQNVSIADNIIYLAPTSAIDNDLGIVGHYNDGTYRHAGIFMDASDGHSWKVFTGLEGETNATIDTAGTGFTLADFKGGAFTGTSFNGTINSTNGVVSGSSQITLSSTTGGGTTANVQFNSLGIGMAASATAGRIDATNDIVAYSSSDIRFKENITPIENPLEKISQIGGYTYDWKEENKIDHGYEGNDVGVIAQEIEAVLPQLVQTRDNGYKAVKYDKLVALLIAGMKEQQSQIEELRNKINELESGL